jgi:hypothetical protein
MDLKSLPKTRTGRDAGRLAVVEFRALRHGCCGRGRDRVGVDGAKTGSKQNAGERTIVRPTRRKLREGWGTRRATFARYRIFKRQVGKMVELVAGLIDVFADAPLTGNPLAVVQGADGLSDEQMRRIAGEFNQAETTFILQSARADRKLRSFTAVARKSLALATTLSERGSGSESLERSALSRPRRPSIRRSAMMFCRLNSKR